MPNEFDNEIWEAKAAAFKNANRQEKLDLLDWALEAATVQLNKQGLNTYLLQKLRFEMIKKAEGVNTTLLDQTFEPPTQNRPASQLEAMKRANAAAAVDAYAQIFRLRGVRAFKKEALNRVAKEILEAPETINSWRDKLLSGVGTSFEVELYQSRRASLQGKDEEFLEMVAEAFCSTAELLK